MQNHTLYHKTLHAKPHFIPQNIASIERPSKYITSNASPPSRFTQSHNPSRLCMLLTKQSSFIDYSIDMNPYNITYNKYITLHNALGKQPKKYSNNTIPSTCPLKQKERNLAPHVSICITRHL